MISNRSPETGAVIFRCPENFKAFIRDRFGDVFIPLDVVNEQLHVVGKADYVYLFQDCATIFAKGEPVVKTLQVV